MDIAARRIFFLKPYISPVITKKIEAAAWHAKSAKNKRITFLHTQKNTATGLTSTFSIEI
jgi:hypothetical protein